MIKNLNIIGFFFVFKVRFVNYKWKVVKGFINGEVGDVFNFIFKVVGIEIFVDGGLNMCVFGYFVRGIVEL